MKRYFAALFSALALVMAAPVVQAQETDAAAMTAEQQAEVTRIKAVLDALKPQTGSVALPAAHATLALGEDFYFLDAADSGRVLTEIWGNPPGSAEGVMGMVFPAGTSPVGETWGAVVTYVADGYVSDHDASTMNYAKLLEAMREGEDEGNRQRQAQGYAGVHLVGWAQQPSYDPGRHSLIWAKDLAFTDSPDHTLNYDVRVLGRGGVLSMNIVAAMSDLPTVGAEANRLMATASFDAGSTYADYKDGVDKKAEYGVAGLIAGGAALAVAKKVGFLGILLLFVKKGAVFLIAGAGAAMAWFRRMFGGKARASAQYVPTEGPEDLSPIATPDEPREDLSPYSQDPPADRP